MIVELPGYAGESIYLFASRVKRSRLGLWAIRINDDGKGFRNPGVWQILNLDDAREPVFSDEQFPVGEVHMTLKEFDIIREGGHVPCVLLDIVDADGFTTRHATTRPAFVMAGECSTRKEI